MERAQLSFRLTERGYSASGSSFAKCALLAGFLIRHANFPIESKDLGDESLVLRDWAGWRTWYDKAPFWISILVFGSFNQHRCSLAIHKHAGRPNKDAVAFWTDIAAKHFYRVCACTGESNGRRFNVTNLPFIELLYQRFWKIPRP